MRSPPPRCARPTCARSKTSAFHPSCSWKPQVAPSQTLRATFFPTSKAIRYASPVVAGSGNNGADALVAARYLMQLGYEPDIYMAAKGADCNDLCRSQLEMMQGLGASVSFLREQSPEFFRSGLRAASLIVDGLLGTGSSGAPERALPDLGQRDQHREPRGHRRRYPYRHRSRARAWYRALP